jgi:hypothetical protein
MIGDVNSVSGASGFMPKVSNEKASPQNASNILDLAQQNTQQTQKVNSKMSPEELLKMLSENTKSPLSNVSSNDLLSLLQNDVQSNNKNNSNNLMNSILSAYSNDSNDKKSYTAAV